MSRSFSYCPLHRSFTDCMHRRTTRPPYHIGADTNYPFFSKLMYHPLSRSSITRFTTSLSGFLLRLIVIKNSWSYHCTFSLRYWSCPVHPSWPAAASRESPRRAPSATVRYMAALLTLYADGPLNLLQPVGQMYIFRKLL